MCHVLFVNQHILQTRIVAIVKRRGRFKRASRLLLGPINMVIDIRINKDRNQESTRMSTKYKLNPSLLFGFPFRVANWTTEKFISR